MSSIDNNPQALELRVIDKQTASTLGRHIYLIQQILTV